MSGHKNELAVHVWHLIG